MKKFLSNSFIVSFFLLLSKIFGFVRDMLIASLFGAGTSAQAFMVAFRIPEFMRKVSSSGAITQIVNPYVKGQINKNQKEFIVSILFIIAVIMIVVILILSIFAGFTISIYASGFSDTKDVAVLSENLFRIMIPYTLFIFIVAIISAVLNSYSKYIATSVIPIVLNVVMIIAMLVSVRFNGSIYCLAYGVLIAGIIQFLIAVICLYRIFGKIEFSKNIILLKNSQAIIFLKKFPASFIGVAVLQISSLLEMFFASFLVSGSLAWLYYADRVNQFLYGVFGTAIATVAIPYLLRHKDNKSEFQTVFKKVFNLAIFVSIPAICGLMLLSKPIVITLFNYGEFNVVDVQNTRLAMLGYSLSLLCFILIRVVTSALYVCNKSDLVFKISLFCLFLNIVLGILVIYFFANSLLGFLWLAIVTSMIAFTNLVLQMMIFAKDKKSFYEIFIPLKFLLKIFVSALFMSLFIYVVNADDNVWFGLSLHLRFLYLSLILMVAVIIYLLCMFILKTNNDLLLNDNSF